MIGYVTLGTNDLPRAAAFSRPSVTSRLRGLMSGVEVMHPS